MKFIQRDKHHIESECKRYTVDKAIVGKDRTRYTAWRRTDSLPENLGCFDTAAKAQAQCDQHQLAATKPTLETTP